MSCIEGQTTGRRACLDHESGLMSGSDWKFRMARQYLRKEEQLLELIMLIFFLRGGQAPRTTELLFSVECCNGSATSRGLYVHSNSLMYVTCHSKARRTTSQALQVARYLPVDDSVLLTTYLIYIRPFADMLYRTCFGGSHK